ncbi:PfkB family carbohydrate kinase [Lentisphaerota bacterium ZTH]|nr:carbohydrate kinase [Lentisphaerota bacterium]WET07414.1 PfkB family carbohydrate kinase [Lentisphaerota bacterium ZTH]
MKKNVIVGIGEILWDIFPEGKKLGGAPCNFAYHSSAQGAEGITVSAVGSDQNGDEIIAAVKARKLSADYISRNSYPTGTVSVEVKAGKPSYIIHQNTAWDNLQWTDSLHTLAAQADAVCFGSLAQRNSITAETIHKFLDAVQESCIKVFDVNLRQNFYTKAVLEKSLMHTDILKISDEELPAFAATLELDTPSEEDLFKQLFEEFNLDMLVFTRGEKGCRCICPRTKTDDLIPASNPGKLLDTVGCGDSFTAAFTVGILRGLSPREAAGHAVKVAGFVSTCSGGTPEIPSELVLK